MAETLGLTVTAEGIETTEQLEILRGFGCSHGQGYLFSRPVPPDAFAKLYQDQQGQDQTAPSGSPHG